MENCTTLDLNLNSKPKSDVKIYIFLIALQTRKKCCKLLTRVAFTPELDGPDSSFIVRKSDSLRVNLVKVEYYQII